MTPRRLSPYLAFIAPAIVVVGAVIVFPWLFTLWMSLFDWKIGDEPAFIGLANFRSLIVEPRFLESIVHTLVFTVLAVRDQVAPPTINIFNQDPDCDLDYCANTAREMKIELAVKNNFGFGGTNGTLVFKRV